ncbi:MAG: Na+/H+ antiporter NhaA, partial [Ginsengibacter sp.]
MKRLIQKAISPIRFFINDSRSTGMLLLFCTVVSLLLANTVFGEGYASIWTKEIHYGFTLSLPHSGLTWINDFLMAIFFLFAGMEIKR